MAFTINGTTGLTFPDTTTQATRAVNRSGDSMTGDFQIVGSQKKVSVIDGSKGISIGHWDTTNNRYEMTGAKTLFAQYGNYDVEIANQTNGGTWKMDSYGRVTHPYQPAFRAGAVGGAITVPQSNNTNLMSDISNGGYNIGGHYNTSTSTFTAPVAGLYLFWVGLFFVSPIGYDRWFFYGGGYSSFPYAFANTGPDAGALSGSSILKLQANDSITLAAQYGGSTVYRGHSAWGGYLLG